MQQNNPYNIQFHALQMGNDLAMTITGGASHIGAVATAYFDSDLIKVAMQELPHHKEGLLAKECAQSLAKELNCTVTVLMGIHIDNATKEQIEDIIYYVRAHLQKLIKNPNNILLRSSK